MGWHQALQPNAAVARHRDLALGEARAGYSGGQVVASTAAAVEFASAVDIVVECVVRESTAAQIVAEGRSIR